MTETVGTAEEALVEFRRQVRGVVLRDGDPGYDEARRVWNGMIDRKPAVIVRCTGAADVIAAVRFARQSDLVIAVKGGGHSVSGASVCDGGLMIDLSPMKSIRVDPKGRTARAEPGVNWGEFDAETQAFGLGMTGGQITHTGIAGLTLGGGVGWLARKYGMVVDNLLSVDIVTANGELRTASETENPDLFWAVRGGGGNFGIVTSFEYRLYPVGPIVVGGMIGYELEHAREVLRRFREIAENGPDELTLTAAFISAPPAPFVPEHLHFKPIMAIAVCWCGDIEEGMRTIEPLRAGAAFEAAGPMPYTVVQQMLDEGTPYGTRRYYAKSGFLNELTDDLIEALLSAVSNPPSPFTITVVVGMGGATSRVDPNATAFAHRNVHYDLTTFPGWNDPADDERQIAWGRNFFQIMHPFMKGVYVNALGDDGKDRLTEAYPPETYARLVEIKNRYDPENVFRLNQNVRPVTQ